MVAGGGGGGREGRRGREGGRGGREGEGGREGREGGREEEVKGEGRIVEAGRAEKTEDINIICCNFTPFSPYLNHSEIWWACPPCRQLWHHVNHCPNWSVDTFEPGMHHIHVHVTTFQNNEEHSIKLLERDNLFAKDTLNFSSKKIESVI